MFYYALKYNCTHMAFSELVLEHDQWANELIYPPTIGVEFHKMCP
jgi:hypothetical protein